MTMMTMAALPMVDATDGGSGNSYQLMYGDGRNQRVRTHRDDVGVNIVAKSHVAGNGDEDVYGRS
jgi:hypothetical protein